MARTSAAFEWLAARLERATPLNRPEARGTLRLALRQAGLDALSVTPDQTAVVLERVLPAELAVRGIREGARICEKLAAELRSTPLGTPETATEGPEAVFRRLGGD